MIIGVLTTQKAKPARRAGFLMSWGRFFGGFGEVFLLGNTENVDDNVELHLFIRKKSK